MKIILDVGMAVDDGCDIPRVGLFRGEVAEIVKRGKRGSVVVKLPNSLDPHAEYVVKEKHLIYEEE